MPASRPASSAARAGWRRPCWSPRRPTATTPSSTSPTAAFDLTDRGVKGRVGAGAHRRLRLHRPRRLPPRRGGAPGGARPRRAPARRRPFPSPSSSRAPTASSTQRVTLTDQGQGGRATTLDARRLGHDRHLARQGARRPQGQPDRASLVPGRGLRARAPGARSSSPARRRSPRRSPAPSSSPAATSTGRRPPASPSRARSPSSSSTKDVPGFAGYRFGLADEQVAPCASRSRACPPPTPKARPTSPCKLPALPKTSRPLEADVILQAAGNRAGAPSSARITLPVDLKSAAHRHQAAVREQPDGGRRARPLRGHRARRRRQGHRGQGPQVGAACASTSAGSGTAATARGTTRP